MSACPRCGEENEERARFCWSCGSALSGGRTLPLHTRRTVTVLFCDLTGFTSLGAVHDPERLRGVMSRYYAVTRSALERHGGTVEKFIGDAVMAVFGIPVLHEDDALRALRGAVEVRDSINRLNVELEQTFGLTIAVRIGVNSGEVIAGDPADGASFVAGDPVNVAQRLESAAPAGEILLGEQTYRLARDAIETEELEPIRIKGKADPVPAHRLVEVLTGVLSHARRFDSTMVGRERELAILGDAFERSVLECSCHLFTVLGPAGVGKSRLLAEALEVIGERATVLSSACLPYGEGITFWPALEIVKQATGVTDDDTAAEVRAKLEAAFEGEESASLAADRVSALVGLDGGHASAEEGFWGFRKLLEAVARRTPLVVVFDDANWAEPTFLDLVEHVAEWTREAPILLVLLARPDLLDARRGWAGGNRNATTIFLEPLSEAESETLLRNLLGGTDVPAGVLARIFDAAEGNPLFVEEMVSMLIDGGFLQRENGGWVEGGDLSTVSVPATIQLLLASRLDQLASDERQVIERATIEGTVFHRGAVAALSEPRLQESVPSWLESLLRKELIRPHRASVLGEDAFRFRHALIREAAYEAIPKQVRAELHERFAVWLEDVTGERVIEVEEVLGYHLEQAFRYRVELARADERTRALAVRAGSRLGAAGRRALARGDAPAAVNLLQRSVSLLEAGDAPRIEALVDLGTAHFYCGELAEADSALASAIEAAESAGEHAPAERAKVERSLVRLYHDRHFALDDARALADRAIEAFEGAGDELGIARALVLVAHACWSSLQLVEMEEVLERALVHAERGGDKQEVAAILSNLCRAALLGPAPVEDGIRQCRDTLARTPGNQRLEAEVQEVMSVLVAAEGRFDEARELVRRGEQTFRELGLVGFLLGGSMYGAWVELLAGEPAAAEAKLRASYAQLEALGEKSQLSTIASFLAVALCDQGLLEEAERFTVVCEESASPEDLASQIEWRSTRARVLAARGEAAQAEPLAREAVALAERTDGLGLRADALVELAGVLRAQGKDAEAEDCLSEAVALYEQKGNVVMAARSRRKSASHLT